MKQCSNKTMSSINVSNQTSYRLPRQLILNTLRRVFKYLKIQNSTLSVVFVSPAMIKKLNSRYRRQNRVTNVLSFNYSDHLQPLNGEIIICYLIAKQQAKRFNHSIQEELTKLLIHGLLHLLGHHHHNKRQATKTEQLEQKLMQRK